MAYGDVAAAMNALPRAGETLNGAWTRQDLLYESDTEALSVNPLTISKKDSKFSPSVSLALFFLAPALPAGSGSKCVYDKIPSPFLLLLYNICGILILYGMKRVGTASALMF